MKGLMKQVISSIIYTDTKAYFDKVLDQALLDLLKTDYPKVYDHVQKLIASMEETIQRIDSTNFWQLMPEILGYDSRFVLLNSLQLSEDKLLTELEILQMIERDYPNLNKEFCGYSLKEQEHESLIFSVQ
ncbi:hypothetical protein ENLAB_05280 [Enterococcus innesii]|jgi:hypothetical protein|uniref:Uncharacterized protein n=1 Tax=Enterococcus innesii TaxID=2839759 RepID=A0ABM7XPK1_9ENTE|nr:hypothetical protein [Enterococcus innesii]BDG66964.1 hypothetical protein ENLAB_05280 [Enterococcus innesii]